MLINNCIIDYGGDERLGHFCPWVKIEQRDGPLGGCRTLQNNGFKLQSLQDRGDIWSADAV